MRFLVDAQLPPALARFLASAGHEAEHVDEIGLVSAADSNIWRYAKDHDAIIVTKDEDFVALRAFSGQGPAVVWVRIGNTTREALLGRMSSALPAVIAALERGETVVEVTGA